MPSFRDAVSGNPAVVAGLATLVLAGSWWIILKPGHGSATQPADAYFFDTATGELFPAPTGDIPPIKAPSGEEGVKAHVFSCGDCNDPDQRFVAYLEKYTAEAKQALRDKPDDPTAIQSDSLLRGTPDGKQWYVATSLQGSQFGTAARRQCAGRGQPTRCHP